MRIQKMLLTMIMSLFSSVLFGLAPCNSNCAALVQENTIEIKCKDNLVKNFGYLLVSPVEFLSKNEFYEGQSHFRTESTAGTIYTLPYFSANTKLIPYNHVDITNSDYGYNSTWANSIYDCYWKYVSGGTTNYTLYKTWDFVISIANGDYLLTNRVMLSYNDTSTDTSFLGVSYVGSTFQGPNNPYWFCVCNSNAWLYTAPGIVNDDFDRGMTQGYNVGFDDGYDSGVERGKEIASDPASDIYQATYNAGKQVGDTEGYQRAISQGSTAATIFSGIVTVGLLPVNVLLTMFQYEVFGINIAGLVSGLFTIAVVIIIIRLVTGKKND